MSYPLIVPFWNRAPYLFPLLVSLTRALIRPQDVYLCEDAGSAAWIRNEIAERFPLFNVQRSPEHDPQQDGADHSKSWAKGQWHCVRSVNRVLETVGWPPAFFYLESDCLVARSAFVRLAFLWDWYTGSAGVPPASPWQPLAKIGAHRGRAWSGQRTYQPPLFGDRDWVEDLYGGCWFGILNGELWRRFMLEGQGPDGVYDPRRKECDFADSFFDRQCQSVGARFLRTTTTLIQHQGMTDALNPQHWPAADFVGEMG